MRNATLNDDIKDPSCLYSLEHPDSIPPNLNPLERLSVNIFLGLSGGSQRMYKSVRDSLKQHDGALELLSYHCTKKLIDDWTGIVQLHHDMCPNGCTAYTGDYSDIDKCPACGELRYTVGKKGKPEPRQQFTTIPLGPQIQAQFRSPEGADRMQYRNQKTDEVQEQLRETNGRLEAVDDVFCGQQYLDAENDVLLYQDKESNCWIFQWILLDLDPNLRYKKKYVLPGGFVPGPKKPQNLESYLLPCLRHVAALQRKGLKVWDAFPTLSGRCPFHGRNKPGKGVYYPVALQPHDAPADYPNDKDVDTKAIGQPSPETYLQNVHFVMASRTTAEYNRRRKATGIVRPSICLGFQPHLAFPPPSCFPLDLMHLASLNLPQHLISIWRGTIEWPSSIPEPDFFVLQDPDTWVEHGALVASVRPYLPSYINRPPRNPAEKINSQYKACEFMIYFWMLGPAVFLCKLVRGIRILHQRTILRSDLVEARNLLHKWEHEFEEEYYARKIKLLHMVAPCIHGILHGPEETFSYGPLSLVAQWAMENTIGSLGQEVHQPSNPFANLAERGRLRAQTNALYALIPSLEPPPITTTKTSIPFQQGAVMLHPSEENEYEMPADEVIAYREYLEHRNYLPKDGPVLFCRWARFKLPNGEIIRSAWKERERRNQEGRTSRNIAFSPYVNSPPIYGEVQYFFTCELDGHGTIPLALVMIYSQPLQDLLEDSSGTLMVCKPIGRKGLNVIEACWVTGVVAMIPFPLTPTEMEDPEQREKYGNAFYVGERLTHEIYHSDDVEDEADST
ncbi:hypothetical protein BDN72DRAFT_873100 [Pluteus cervinus]|uniref:Uncharacterized protein n=1 Tax=Pluteus cervinus TaxID=181527 RepID=A0ACD3A0F1_9AGAR|nr:hypothetical protein BDN72DRAFT_873100 [Pluteus cervinus]